MEPASKYEEVLSGIARMLPKELSAYSECVREVLSLWKTDDLLIATSHYAAIVLPKGSAEPSVSVSISIEPRGRTDGAMKLSRPSKHGKVTRFEDSEVVAPYDELLEAGEPLIQEFRDLAGRG